MRLIGSRGDAQPWMAVVHDHLVLAAAPTTEDRSEHIGAPNCWPPAGRHRSRICASDCSTSRALGDGQPAAGIAVSLGLSLVGDAYPEFPDTHPAWGPRLAGALGAAVAAAGLAGRVHQVQPLVAPHAFSDDGGVWVIERIGDVAPAAQAPGAAQAVATFAGSLTWRERVSALLAWLTAVGDDLVHEVAGQLVVLAQARRQRPAARRGARAACTPTCRPPCS